MFQYPLKYQLLDYFFDFLFFGILKDDPKEIEPRFVRFAFVIQILKMVAVAGVLAAISCVFLPLGAAFGVLIIASFFLILLGTMAFPPY